MTWYVLLIAAVAVERLAELVVARRNMAWSLARGGVEYGAGHYRSWWCCTGLLLGCVVEVAVVGRPFIPTLGWSMLAIALAAQGLRWWCIARWAISGTPGLWSSRGLSYREGAVRQNSASELRCGCCRRRGPYLWCIPRGLPRWCSRFSMRRS